MAGFRWPGNDEVVLFHSKNKLQWAHHVLLDEEPASEHFLNINFPELYIPGWQLDER